MPDPNHSPCNHDRRIDGQCVACGHCLHDVILNGACYICGSTDIDGAAISPRSELIPPSRLVRDK